VKIYDSFLKLVKETKKEYKEFLLTVVEATEDYSKVIAPIVTDWKEQEAKQVYNSLIALNIFRVSQHRPFLLALLKSHKEKKINITDLREALVKLKNSISILLQYALSGLQA